MALADRTVVRLLGTGVETVPDEVFAKGATLKELVLSGNAIAVSTALWRRRGLLGCASPGASRT